MMNPSFINSNYSSKKSIFVFAIVLDMFCTGVFSDYFMFDGQHIRYQTFPVFSVAKLSDDGRK